MDVHPTKNVSIGIDPYPYYNSMLGIWMHSDPRCQRHGAAPAAVARFGAGVGLGATCTKTAGKMGNPWEIHGDFIEFEWKLMGF